MPKITADLILRLNPRHPAPQVAATKLQVAADHFGITTQRSVAMFVAQVAHESGCIPVEENLSYRASRICQVWPSRFPTVAAAQPYAFNPKALGDRVYSGRMGNGPGEGFKFRGRGLIQLTGKDNDALYGKMIGVDLVGNPDLLLQYGVSALAAGAFWTTHGLNRPADAGDVAAVTRGINGGLVGLDDRERLYQRALTHVPRYGLLETDAPFDVDRDTEDDLVARTNAFQSALELLC